MTEPVDPSEQGWAAPSSAAEPDQAYPPPGAGYPPPGPGYPPPGPGYPPANPPGQQFGAPYLEPPGNLGYTPGQPYAGQTYAGQPYPGQPYPGQPYPGQPYPGQPYPAPQPGEPGWLAAEPARKPRRRLIAAGVVLVLAAAGVVAVLVTGSGSNSPSSGSLALPSSLGGYQMLPGGTADAIRNNVAQSFGTTGQLGKFFTSAAIGTYGDSTQPPPKLVLIAARSGAFPALNANSIGTGGGAFGLKTYAAGKHGGVVDCFDQAIGSVTESICFWTDSKTVGYLLGINATSTPDVAALVNTARDTLDH